MSPKWLPPKPVPVKHATELRRIRRGTVLPPDEGLIVTNHRGGHRLLEGGGGQGWGGPRVHFHDLKHFYTRTLATSGKHDPKTVQRLSRHARFEETWETYTGTEAGAEAVKITAFSDAFTDKGDDAVEAAG